MYIGVSTRVPVVGVKFIVFVKPVPGLVDISKFVGAVTVTSVVKYETLYRKK